jgi:glycosyltransferase involved in cell wall biosynthesis
VKRRILFLLPDLRHGGAERVTVVLLRNLPRERYEPHLALVERAGELLEAVPPDVPVHDLGARRARRAPRPLLRRLREVRPAVVYSTLGYLSLVLLALRRFLPPEGRIVVREPTILSQEVGRKRLPFLWRAAYRWLYPRADAIVCPATTTLEDLATRFAIPRERMCHIPNPVEVESMRAAAEPSPYSTPGPHVVGVGRLSGEKGYDRAIDAFAEVVRAHPTAELWLLGDGPERAALAERAARLGLGDRVHLVGFAANPYPWLKHADAFVQASHYEGMPNALLEALACGTPAAVFAAPGGTREVAAASEGVSLVESSEPAALGHALADLVGGGRPCVPSLPAGYSAREVVATLDALLQRLEP